MSWKTTKLTLSPTMGRTGGGSRSSKLLIEHGVSADGEAGLEVARAGVVDAEAAMRGGAAGVKPLGQRDGVAAGVGFKQICRGLQLGGW